MSDLIPDLERQLRAAARVQRLAMGSSEMPASRPGRWRRLLDPAHIALACSIALALVIGAAAIVLLGNRGAVLRSSRPPAAAFLPAVGCSRAPSPLGQSRLEVAHGLLDGQRWRLMVPGDRRGAARINGGRFVLDGRSYGFCPDPITFELIDAAPRAIAYGFIAGRAASPVTIEAAAGPPRAAPRIAQNYPATVRVLARGTFFLRALPAPACAYRGMALAPAPTQRTHDSARLYLFSFGRCRAGQLVQPGKSQRTPPSSQPPPTLPANPQRRRIPSRTTLGQSG